MSRADEPFEMKTVYCEASVAGETVYVRQLVPAAALRDPETKKLLTEALRHRLMAEILKKWQPVVRIR